MTRVFPPILSRTSSRTLWFIAALATPTLATNLAFADEACGDRTCQKGYICQSYGVGICVDRVAPYESTCTNKTIYECVPGPCAADADCADGMVCHAYTTAQCINTPKPTCASGTVDCVGEDVETPGCTTKTEHRCVARYDLPCTTARDCGPGFTCEEQIACGCSGVRGTAGAGGADTPATNVTNSSDTPGLAGGAPSMEVHDPPTGPGCDCEPTGTFACELQTIACNVDANCPSGLICSSNRNGVCWSGADGTTACSVPEPARLCMPASMARIQDDSSDSLGSGGTQSGTPILSPAEALEQAASVDGGTEDGDTDRILSHPISVHRYGCALAAAPAARHSSLFLLLLSAGAALGLRGRRPRK